MYDFRSQQKIITEVDSLILDGISFQDSAPAYLIDLSPYWKVFLPMIYSVVRLEDLCEEQNVNYSEGGYKNTTRLKEGYENYFMC